MSQPTPQQLTAAIEAAAALLQMIASHGAQGIPSGHLYAHVVGIFPDLGSYEACLGLLVKSQLVRREGLLLIAAKL